MSGPAVATVGMVGLGHMGLGMALSLRRAGFGVVGTSASAATRSRAALEGLAVVDTAREVAQGADAIVLSLPAPEAVADVVEGPRGLLEQGRYGQFVVDTTTSSPGLSRRLAARLAQVGMGWVDAPVSGSPDVARAGGLTMMVGGADADVAAAEPLLAALGARRFHVGPAGTGHLAKLANNLLAATHLLAAAEVVELAKEAGLDVETLIPILNASTGRSFVTEVVYPRWVLNGRLDLGFRAGLMRKDVRLALEEATRHGVRLPLAEQAGRIWAESRARVGDREDVTRIAELPAQRPREATPSSPDVSPS